MTIAGAGPWMAHPRMRAAVEAMASSPTARAVLEDAASLRTRVTFEPTPTSVAEMIDAVSGGAMASYRPPTNTMRFGYQFGAGSTTIPTSGGGSVRLGGSAGPVDDGVTLVHESMHRLQYRRPIPSVLASLVVDPIAAPIAGVREIGRRTPGTSMKDAFLRGHDRQAARREIEAFRTADKAGHEVGATTKYHGPEGQYLGDDVVLDDIRPAYAKDVRRRTAMGLFFGGMFATAGVLALTGRDGGS